MYWGKMIVLHYGLVMLVRIHRGVLEICAFSVEESPKERRFVVIPFISSAGRKR
jgi:hypothetical protein